VAATALLLYAGQKAYMAVRGEIGMPASPAPDWVQAQHQHPALEQAGNAALGVMTAMLALATITRWGSRIPRWLLLRSLAVASVLLSMGAAVDIWRMGRDPDNPTATAVLEAAWTVVQIAAWFVVVFSYALRTRPTRDVLR